MGRQIMIRKILITFFATILIFSSLFGVDFQNNLQQMAENNAKGYVQPLITGLGTSYNSGLYKKARVKPGGIVIPIGFDLGIVTSTAIVPKEDKNFNFQIPKGKISIPIKGQQVNLNYNYIYESKTTPTIAGKGKTDLRKSNATIAEAINDNTQLDNVKASDVENSDIPPMTIEGLNASVIANIGLQANIRLPFIGLEITGRGFPEYQLGDFGKISNIGIGLRKSLPVPIFDLTAGAMYQNLNIDDFVELKNMNYNLVIGKSLSIPFLLEFSPYVGAGLDQTTVSINYNLERTNTDIKFDLNGENQFRINGGITAQIIPFTYLNFEVSRSKYWAGTVSTGIILK